MRCARSIRPSSSKLTRSPELAIILFGLIACDRPRITSCDQDLGGEYAAGDRRWMVLDHGDSLEVYPVFPDAAASTLEVAPRWIELWREAGQLQGQTNRRYMSGAAMCTAHVPVTVARCTDNTLELVLAEPVPPLTFTPCTWGRTEPARVERWIRR